MVGRVAQDNVCEAWESLMCSRMPMSSAQVRGQVWAQVLGTASDSSSCSEGRELGTYEFLLHTPAA